MLRKIQFIVIYFYADEIFIRNTTCRHLTSENKIYYESLDRIDIFNHDVYESILEKYFSAYYIHQTVFKIKNSPQIIMLQRLI